MPLGFDPVGGSSLTDTQASQTSALLSIVLSGLSATGGVGTPSVSSRPRAATSLSSLQGYLGVVDVNIGCNVAVAGVSGASLLNPLGDLRYGGNRTVFARGEAAAGSVGLVAPTVTNLHITFPVAGVSATGQIGEATVPDVDSAFTFPVEGVAALGLVGEVSFIQGATVVLTGLVGTMPKTFGINTTIATFGSDLTAAVVAEWVPVKQA